MTTDFPFFRWFAADAETDDVYAGMTNAEVGFYHRCLNRSWINGGIPADLDILRRSFRLTVAEFNRVWPAVSKRFEAALGNPNRLVDPHQEREREHAMSKSLANQRMGNANAKRTRTERDANGSQRALARDFRLQTTEEEQEKSACAPQTGYLNVAPMRRAPPASKLNGHGAEWSAALYARHPKKKDEALVGGALFRVMEEAADPPALFAEIDRVHRLWCATFDWSEKNGRFAPVLAAWLMDHGWTKEPHEDKSELERMMDRI